MPDKGILILYGSLSKNKALLACSEKCNSFSDRRKVDDVKNKLNRLKTA